MLSMFGRMTTSTRTMSALILAIDSARAAVADRRRGFLDNYAETALSGVHNAAALAVSKSGS